MKAKKYPLEKINQQTIQYNFMQQQKKSNEVMAYSYSHIYNLPSTGLRFFTVYGPWGRPDMALYKFTENILLKKN